MQLAMPQQVARGVEVLLAVVSPFQGIIDRPGKTHGFCNKQAISILKNDGYELCAEFFNSFIDELNCGVYWADKGWKNVGHYFVPSTRKGLWHFNNAGEELDRYINLATFAAKRQDFGKSVFLLGAAAHLIQDLCVPHHARAKVFCGHQEFETWAEENCQNYAAANKGFYSENKVSQWLVNNSIVAADLFEQVNDSASIYDYHNAAAILLPRAQRSTAGLFHQFYVANIEQTLAAKRLSKFSVA